MKVVHKNTDRRGRETMSYPEHGAKDTEHDRDKAGVINW